MKKVILCLLIFSVSVIGCHNSDRKENTQTKKEDTQTKKLYDRSVIYEVKGSDLAKNYNNPSYYADKVFNITLRIDYVTMRGNIVDIQYHGGFETDYYGNITGGARIDVILTIEQAKKYDLQKGKVIKFENMVWIGNEQLESQSLGSKIQFETMSFRILEK